MRRNLFETEIDGAQKDYKFDNYKNWSLWCVAGNKQRAWIDVFRI